MEAWRGISPSALPSWPTGTEVPFHHRSSSRQFLEVRWIFAQISPNLPEKLFVQLLLTNFLPQRSWRHFFCFNLQKRSSLFFCKPWGPFFEVKQRWAPFYPDFQGFCLNFQQIKSFGVLLPPLHPHHQNHCFL